MSLNNQANRQSEMGQREAALQSIEEAVTIRRELAARNREAFLPDLAAPLNNQANLQSEMGQRGKPRCSPSKRGSQILPRTGGAATARRSCQTWPRR